MDMSIQIEGDSEEAIAFALLQLVAQAESKLDDKGKLQGVDREWILDTYAECLAAVDGDRDMIEMVPEDLELDEDDDDAEDEDEDEVVTPPKG